MASQDEYNGGVQSLIDCYKLFSKFSYLLLEGGDSILKSQLFFFCFKGLQVQTSLTYEAWFISTFESHSYIFESSFHVSINLWDLEEG